MLGLEKKMKPSPNMLPSMEKENGRRLPKMQVSTFSYTFIVKISSWKLVLFILHDTSEKNRTFVYSRHWHFVVYTNYSDVCRFKAMWKKLQTKVAELSQAWYKKR